MVFQASTDLFVEYVDGWMDVKETTTGGARVIAKLHLNSLYGKFGSRCDIVSKQPQMQGDGSVGYCLTEPDFREPVFTAVAVFTTAYARELIIRAAQAHYDDFVYCDTDSLHLLGDWPDDLDVHPTRLGAFKHEYDFTEGVYLRPKAYMDVKSDGESEIRISGLPKRVSQHAKLDDFINGRVFDGTGDDGLPVEGMSKLRPVRIPGGISLVPTTFKLSD